MEGRKEFGLDKPARLIIRLLLFGKLNQSTNSETAMLSNLVSDLRIALHSERANTPIAMRKHGQGICYAKTTERKSDLISTEMQRKYKRKSRFEFHY